MARLNGKACRDPPACRGIARDESRCSAPRLPGITYPEITMQAAAIFEAAVEVTRDRRRRARDHGAIDRHQEGIRHPRGSSIASAER